MNSNTESVQSRGEYTGENIDRGASLFAKGDAVQLLSRDGQRLVECEVASVDGATLVLTDKI